MFTEMIKWGHVRRAVDAAPTRLKPQKLLLKSPLRRVAATRLGSKAMRGNRVNRGQERGVDTSYRAEERSSHHTYCGRLDLSHILRVRSGCAWFWQDVPSRFAGFFEGAIRTRAGGMS
jgi:hypothetical protein